MRPNLTDTLESSRNPLIRPTRWLRSWLVMMAVLVGLATPARAALQFDTFFGYDQTVRDDSWFPVACEIFNDGPSFEGVIEISSAQYSANQTRQVRLELPTNTRKRFVIPVFSASGGMNHWTAKLYDSTGKLRMEQQVNNLKRITRESVLLGALPRTFSGAPSFPAVKPKHNGLQPLVARLSTDNFPDNPIALEGLDMIYLNSEKALELKVNQVSALQAWVHGGGHLVVAVEQPLDVNSLPWLRQLLPVQPNSVVAQTMDGELQRWLTQGISPSAYRTVNSVSGNTESPYSALTPNAGFDKAEMPLVKATVRDGQTGISAGESPLMVSAPRGRGTITSLLFNPEREPFKSWEHRTWFWAKLAAIPDQWFLSSDYSNYGGFGIDGVFGAMIDSRQVRKLPVFWLLILLVVYLLVIGPLDQYVLKKLNRQMLTWITFPAYVALFSLLIYFIGYKLRAGESEWNELHLVDVLFKGESAELRGRTFASIYSPVNAQYQLTSQQPHATLRGESQGMWGGGQESSKARVLQREKGFDAEIFVPVWTSQLYVSDWMQPAELPIKTTVKVNGVNLVVQLQNQLDRKVEPLRLVVQGRLYDLGGLAANASTNVTLSLGAGRPLSEFVQSHSSSFVNAIQGRQRSLGDEASGRLEDMPNGSMAASFIAHRGVSMHNQYNQGLVSPPGLDLSPLVERGDAVILAWTADYSPAASIVKFNPRRSSKNTLFRIAVPIEN